MAKVGSRHNEARVRELLENIAQYPLVSFDIPDHGEMVSVDAALALRTFAKRALRYLSLPKEQ